MAEDEVKVRLTVDGVEESVRDLERVSKSEKQLAEQTDATGNEAAKTTERQKELRDQRNRSAQEARDQANAERRLEQQTHETGDEVDRATKETAELSSARDRAAKEAAQLAGAESKLERETRDAADAGDDASRSMGEQDSQTEQLRANVERMVLAWASFSAAGAAIVGLFRDITEAAKETVTAVSDVGELIRGLAANVGGEAASEIFRGVTAIAAESGFNVQGRAELVESVASLTDIREGLTTEEVLQAARQRANLQRATGVGGAAGNQVLIGLEENLQLTPDQSVDAATTLLNAGLNAETVSLIAERGGNVGGMDLLSLLLASRQTGLDLRRSGRGVNTIVAALTQRDADGTLADPLEAAGLSADQNIYQRVESLVEGRRTGRFSQSTFEEAIGGAENLRFFEPFSRAIERQLVDQARAGLLDPNANERAIAELQRSEYIIAQERQNTRDLLVQVRREQSRMTEYGENIANLEADSADLPTVFKPGYMAANAFTYLGLTGDPVARQQAQIEGIRSRVGADELGGQPQRELNAVTAMFAPDEAVQQMIELLQGIEGRLGRLTVTSVGTVNNYGTDPLTRESGRVSE